MAGVFDTYRHHKKLIFWLIIVAMGLFMVGGSLLGRGGGGSGGASQDPVVATWKFGTIHAGDLQRLAQQQQMLRNYFAAVFGGEYHGPAMTQTEALNQLLLAKKGEQMGIVISDEKVRDELRMDVIRSIPRGMLDQQQLFFLLYDKDQREKFASNSRLSQALSHVRLSQEQLFALERRTMLVRRVAEIFENGARQEPPGEMWDDYLREKLRITAEIVELPVADYVEQVPAPSESVLKQFYENNKDKFARDGQPGFRQPYKASFQFFKADIASFLRPAEATITDEQIKDYYDTHKDQFKDLELPKDSDAKDSEKKEEEKKDGDAKGDKGNGADKAADKKDAPQDGDKKDAPPADKKAADLKATDSKPTGSKAPDKKAADPKAVDPKKPAAKTGAFSPLPTGGTPGTLAAFNVSDGVQLAAAPPVKKAADPAAKAKPTEPVKPAEKAAPTADPAKTAPAADKTPAAAEKTGAEKTGAAKADDKKASADKLPADDKQGIGDSKAFDDLKLGDEKAPPKYKPLEKVKDDIRRILALVPARKAAREALEAAETVVQDYGTERSNWRIDRLTNPQAPEPAPANFAETAKKHGLVLLSTGLMSRDDLMKSSDLKNAFFRVDEQNVVPFVNRIFAGAMPEYKPQLGEDRAGNLLMIWLDEEQKEMIPPYDLPADEAKTAKSDSKKQAELKKLEEQVQETRDAVKQAWKMMEARKLAKQEADRLAAVARKDPHASLKDSLSKESKQVKQIGPFSWESKKLPNSPLTTNAVPDVPDAGDEFMRAVYALEEGQVGTAWNQPKTDCYIVKVDNWEPSQGVLVTEFQTDAGSRRFGDQAALQALGGRWLDSLKAEFGVKLEKGFEKDQATSDTSGMPADDEG